MSRKRSWSYRLSSWVVRTLAEIGGLAVGAPDPPVATNNYGLAGRGAPILVFIIGLALGVLVPPVGLVLMIFAAAALLVFSVIQYHRAIGRWQVLGWLLGLSIVLAAAISLVWANWSPEGNAGAITIIVALVASLSCLIWVPWVFRLIFGPHHPVSPQPEPKIAPPLWYWVGDVHPDRAELVARLSPTLRSKGEVEPHSVTVIASRRAGGATAIAPGTGAEAVFGPTMADEHGLARISLTGLQANSRYDLEVVAQRGEQTVGLVEGTFTTFPDSFEEGDDPIRLAFGSCLSTGSRGQVFDTIAKLQPHLFGFIGDLHYENIETNSIDRFLQAFDRVHQSAPVSRLLRTTPMAYMWDDHDFGDNDSDHLSPSKPAAQAAYRLAVPSYLDSDPGTDDGGAIHQSFTIGPVKVVMTDNRSELGETKGNLINPEAERWLIDHITDPSHDLVLWVSPTPWIGQASDSDDWSGCPDQRARIAEAIGARRANLVMVSGDAHMVAIDDGANSGYAGPDSGFPVLHAASLDRLGSTKGGPFSHGTFPGAGRFGLVTVEHRGDTLGVEIAGRRWTGETIVRHGFSVPLSIST